MILDNMDGEGIDDLKEYNRNQLLLSGVIKPRTPEEKQMVAQAKAQQQNQPSPDMVNALANQGLAVAENKKADNQSMSLQIEAAKVITQDKLADAKIAEIFNSMNLDQRKEFRELMAQQGDNARADAELILKSQAQGHTQRMDLTSLMQSVIQKQQPQQ